VSALGQDASSPPVEGDAPAVPAPRSLLDAAGSQAVVLLSRGLFGAHRGDQLGSPSPRWTAATR